jgi:tellurite resistance protein TerC
MFHVTPLGWAATIVAIVALFALDLTLSSRRPRAVGLREALAWSAFYVAIALLFGVALGALAGWNVGGQYLAGYLVEKSLSLDNLFVFVIILANFAVPLEQQRRTLTLGIALALALRAIFILLGAALLQAFDFMFVVFGALLLVTAVQLYRHRDEDPTVDDNLLVRAAGRALPFTREYRGGRLLVRIDGHRTLTPLALVLVALASTDLLFAFDSIPAVFGVSRHAYVVLCANAFALLGLRAMFFLVSGVLDRLVYMSSGLALILAFVGAKLILHFAHDRQHSIPELSTGVSLAVIVGILAITALASAVALRRSPDRRAHAGAVVPHPHDRNGSSSGAGGPM